MTKEKGEIDVIDLSGLADGAVSERFQLELQRVLENIADPNTDPKKARTLTLTLTLRGNELRDIASVNIVAKTKLAPARDVEAHLLIDQDSKGRIVAAELKSGAKGQMYISEDGEVLDDRGQNVVPMERGHAR